MILVHDKKTDIRQKETDN